MFELIPAIDLRHGQVVRLEQGDDARRECYSADPLALLATFADAGIRRVHVVDLDAAFGEAPQRALIARLAAHGGLAIELGGGLRDEAAIAWALGVGCERLVLGSLVVRDPAAFAALAARYAGRLVPAVEVEAGALKVAGWRERAPLGLGELCATLRDLPCPAVLCTDVERDGMLSGPNYQLAADVAARTGIGVLVSGGVGGVDDVLRARDFAGLDGVIVGKAFYAGRLDLAQTLAALRAGEAA
jgi:phosphoribosylformimino-5-aminoimidazole carboxamide ribotide isomerase